MSKTKIYCFDTSAFIRINRFYPREIFSDLWEELESVIKSGNLISHQICLEEIMPKTKKPDFLGEWVKDKASIFKKITPRQIEIVTEILEINLLPGTFYQNLFVPIMCEIIKG